jgi:hypothetical protein
MEKKWVFAILIFAILAFLIVFLFSQQNRNVTGKITGNVVSDDCLFAHYEFENNIGDSARGNTGRNHGASYVKGKVDNSLSFDGIDDYVSLSGIDTQMFNNTADFTLSTWYMPTSKVFSKTDGKQSYFFGGTKSPYGLRLNKEGDEVYLGHLYWVTEANSYLTIEDSKRVELNRWYHIASTYSYSTQTLCLYINGELVSCKDLSVYGGITIINKASQFMIGGISYGYTSPSKMDESKIWDCALSEEQVIEEFESYGEKVDQELTPPETQEPTTPPATTPPTPPTDPDSNAIPIIVGVVIVVILILIFRKKLKKFFK